MIPDELSTRERKDAFLSVVSTRNTSDDEMYTSDPELARARSKLKVLFHAATCPCDGLSDCPANVVHCCASKRLFAHIITCMAGYDCEVPGCKHSRRVWRHYRNCEHNSNNVPGKTTGVSLNANCPICSAVPVEHNVTILCDRFRKKSRMPSLKTTRQHVRYKSNGNDISANGLTGDVKDDKPNRELDNQHRFDQLPVWRKRNLIHAQHQHLHVENSASFEKENVASSERSFASRPDTSAAEGEIRLSEPLQSDGKSQKSMSFGRNRNTNANHRHHDTKLHGSDGAAKSISSTIQLPLHPRDGRRRINNGSKAISQQNMMEV